MQQEQLSNKLSAADLLCYLRAISVKQLKYARTSTTVPRLFRTVNYIDEKKIVETTPLSTIYCRLALALIEDDNSFSTIVR